MKQEMDELQAARKENREKRVDLSQQVDLALQKAERSESQLLEEYIREATTHQTKKLFFYSCEEKKGKRH